MPSKLIDEKGNRYGSLTVIEYTKDKNGRGAWLCQCDCGNTKIVRGPDLRKNKVTHCSKSCPCRINGQFKDETGNEYGYLKVLYKTPFKSSSQKTYWHCKCKCGNECDVIGENLRQGITKSCGCASKQFNSLSHSKDLIGQQFGYLEPIEIVEYGSKDGNIWRCKCNCGCQREDILVPAHSLLSNNTQSCGKYRRSHGELSIENFLKEHNIKYKIEYSFNDLIVKETGKKLRYDFAIFKNNFLYCLIEYDGEQHFKPIEYFGGEEEFIKRQKHDNLKNLYCKMNNIPLLRIKYNEDITNKLQEFLRSY